VRERGEGEEPLRSREGRHYESVEVVEDSAGEQLA
jgi:hypothetical protein